MASDTIFLVNNTIQIWRENEVADLENKGFCVISNKSTKILFFHMVINCKYQEYKFKYVNVTFQLTAGEADNGRQFVWKHSSQECVCE